MPWNKSNSKSNITPRLRVSMAGPTEGQSSLTDNVKLVFSVFKFQFMSLHTESCAFLYILGNVEGGGWRRNIIVAIRSCDETKPLHATQ